MRTILLFLFVLLFLWNESFSQRDMIRLYFKDTSNVSHPINQIDSIVHYKIQKATLQTLGPQSITGQSAYCGGKIINLGMGTLLEVGLCWSTKPNPTIENTKLICSVVDSLFYCMIGGLNRKSTYYVKAYIINEGGVSYGNEITFNTSSSGGTLLHQGYEYNTFVGCDGKEWLQENLKSVVFQNGDTIREARSFDELREAFNNKEPAWCYYEFNQKNDSIYGKLYNYWAAIDDRNIEPIGWIIGSPSELIQCLGGNEVAGGKLKTIGTVENGDGNWLSPNEGATNVSGFSGQPGGMGLFDNGGDNFVGINSYGHWWSVYYYNNRKQDNCCPATQLQSSSRAVGTYNYWNQSLLSIRCTRKN